MILDKSAGSGLISPPGVHSLPGSACSPSGAYFLKYDHDCGEILGRDIVHGKRLATALCSAEYDGLRCRAPRFHIVPNVESLIEVCERHMPAKTALRHSECRGRATNAEQDFERLLVRAPPRVGQPALEVARTGRLLIGPALSRGQQPASPELPRATTRASRARELESNLPVRRGASHSRLDQPQRPHRADGQKRHDAADQRRSAVRGDRVVDA